MTEYCSGCDRHFKNIRAHLINSSHHNYCSFCSKDFKQQRSLQQHEEAVHLRCSDCNHLAQNSHHLVDHKKDNHHYCEACDRIFSSDSNLQSHLNIHKDRALQCDIRGCKKSFVSIAHLILHWETETCPSGASIERLDDFVRKNLTTIINQDCQSNYDSDSDSGYGSRGDDDSWDSKEGRYFCSKSNCAKSFAFLGELKAHLRSPKHAGKSDQYYCPSGDCEKMFSSLSGFAQHFESGACGFNKSDDEPLDTSSAVFLTVTASSPPLLVASSIGSRELAHLD
ncbi:hypothetical protein T439DRAFT_380801 [Meredithblackwellia eburnea MCA 4105]